MPKKPESPWSISSEEEEIKLYLEANIQKLEKGIFLPAVQKDRFSEKLLKQTNFEKLLKAYKKSSSEALKFFKKIRNKDSYTKSDKINCSRYVEELNQYYVAVMQVLGGVWEISRVDLRETAVDKERKDYLKVYSKKENRLVIIAGLRASVEREYEQVEEILKDLESQDFNFMETFRLDESIHDKGIIEAMKSESNEELQQQFLEEILPPLHAYVSFLKEHIVYIGTLGSKLEKGKDVSKRVFRKAVDSYVTQSYQFHPKLQFLPQLFASFMVMKASIDICDTNVNKSKERGNKGTERGAREAKQALLRMYRILREEFMDKKGKVKPITQKTSIEYLNTQINQSIELVGKIVAGRIGLGELPRLIEEDVGDFEDDD